jgi:hypothetical protein
MALLAAQAPNITGSAMTYSAVSASDTVAPGNNVYLHVKTTTNADNVTVVVPGSAYGQARPDIVVALGTSADRHIGPLVADLADPTTGFVTVTHSSTTGVTAAALQFGA